MLALQACDAVSCLVFCLWVLGSDLRGHAGHPKLANVAKELEPVPLGYIVTVRRDEGVMFPA